MPEPCFFSKCARPEASVFDITHAEIARLSIPHNSVREIAIFLSQSSFTELDDCQKSIYIVKARSSKVL